MWSELSPYKTGIRREATAIIRWMSDAPPMYPSLSFKTHPVDWREIDEPDRILQVAVHEAGHAVVASALGIGVIEVRLRDELIGQHGTTVDAPTPFDSFKLKDLRRGAATLMRALGISPELAASRLGHKDAGHLLVTVYAETRRENLRAELKAIAAEGGIDARLASRRLS